MPRGFLILLLGETRSVSTLPQLTNQPSIAEDASGAHLSLRIHRVQEQRQDGRRPALAIGKNDGQSKLTVAGMGFY